MPSLASRLMPAVLRGTKKRMSTVGSVREEVAELALRPTSYAPPKHLERKVELTVESVNGWPVYQLAPRGTEATRRGLYLHGGAYTHQIAAAHWKLIAQLANATATRFSVPIYPLAPIATAEQIVPVVTDLATGLIEDVGADRTVVVGDSAGGGMAVAVALALKQRGLPALQHTVLISPWLDITVDDPAIGTIAPQDPYLAPAGLREYGVMYRGELPGDDPRVSPICGELTELGQITMLSGTRDILNADARRFHELARTAGVDLDYHEAPGMVHVYPLLPIPEAKRARQIIISALCS
jgi:acetyl esterase/lipase